MRTALMTILVGVFGLSAAGCYVRDRGYRGGERARWEQRREHDRDNGYRGRDWNDRDRERERERDRDNRREQYVPY